LYNIEWTPKAFRQLKKIRDRVALKAIKAAVQSLAGWPECRNVKSMTEHAYRYRLRAGAWRVLLDVHQDSGIIEIQEVKKRDEHTY